MWEVQKCKPFFYPSWWMPNRCCKCSVDDMKRVIGDPVLGAWPFPPLLHRHRLGSSNWKSPWTTVISTCLMIVCHNAGNAARIPLSYDPALLRLLPLTSIKSRGGNLWNYPGLVPFSSVLCIRGSLQHNPDILTSSLYTTAASTSPHMYLSAPTAVTTFLSASADTKRLCQFSSCVPPFRRMFALSATGSTTLGAAVEKVVDVVEVNNSIKQTSGAIAVAEEVLENYLQKQKGLQAKDAKFISRNCPAYILKVVAGSLMRWKLKKHSNVENRVLIEQWLKKHEMNELEPFLESIGLNPEKVDEVLPLLQVPLGGDQGLLRTVEILESIGISRRRLWDVLDCNKQLLTITPADLRATVDFLEGLGVKQGKDMVGLIQDSFFLMDNLATLQNLEKIGVQKHVIPEILKSNNPQGGPIDMPVGSFQERMDFLLKSGLSRAEVAQSLKLFPQLLHLRLHNLKRKIQFFDSIGLERERVAKIIARWPLVFRQSVETKLRPKIEMLQSLGVGRDGIAKILTRYPELGAVSLEDNLKQKVAFFEVNGFTGKRLVKLMTSHPRALTLSVNELNKKLDFLVQKGFALGSVEMVRALGVCITISVESMEARFANLESLGFSICEGREVVKQQPAILTLREECIQEKVHYLLNHMNRSIKEIVKCPCCLLYSLELRIKPRHRVLSLLRSEGVLREEAYSLNTIMIMSEKRFMERFVISLGAEFPQVTMAYYKRVKQSIAGR